MTSSSPTVATTSASHSAPDDAVVVDTFDGGELEHQVGDDRAEAAADDLRGDVDAGVAGA